MPVTVRVPAPLRHLCDGRRAVAVDAPTVAAALEALERACPGMRARICEEDGRPRGFLHLFVGDQDIDQRDGLQTTLADGEVLYIVPAEAGGAPVGRADR